MNGVKDDMSGIAKILLVIYQQPKTNSFNKLHIPAILAAYTIQGIGNLSE
jgi:hypothetical protein